MINDMIAHSWLELQEILFNKDAWDEELHRYRSPYAFRGLSDDQYELKTSLMRLGGDYAKLEKHLLRNFRNYSLRNSVPIKHDSVWEWLAVGQHHGLPTRLLDWTYSPYVALHFATEDLEKYDRDGVIWCVNFMAMKQLLPTDLKQVIDLEERNVFTVGMLNRVCSNIMELDNLRRGGEDFIVFLEPPSIDDRIINQYALFSMMSNSRALMDDWLSEHPQYYYRVIIPADLKWEVRDKLDQANVNERILFPGLDGVTAWLKRHYSPTGLSKNGSRRKGTPE